VGGWWVAGHGVASGLGGPTAALYTCLRLWQCSRPPVAALLCVTACLLGMTTRTSSTLCKAIPAMQRRSPGCQLHLQVGPTNEDWPSVEVKQEQKDSAEAIQEVLAAARLGGASPARGEGSAEGSQPDSPSNAADPPAAAMEE